MSFFNKIISFKRRNKFRIEQDPFVNFITSILGYKPINIEIFKEAFTHRAAQKKDDKGNDVNFERLEFLGDALLGAFVAVHLFSKAPDQKEGYLTKMRSKIVSRKQLNTISKELDLLNNIIPHNNIYNLGEDVNGDLLEALVGAIYIDAGEAKVNQFINKKIISRYADLDLLEHTISSYKSIILEWSQKTRNAIKFETTDEQNAQEIQIFVSIIKLNGKVIAKGRGTSKKRAEENAAKRAYYSLKNKFNHR